MPVFPSHPSGGAAAHRRYARHHPAVLKWDAEVSAEAGEYEQLREQHQQTEAREMVEEETQNQHAAPPVSLAEEGLPVQQSESAVGEQAAPGYGGLVRIFGAKPGFHCMAADSGDERGLSRRADG